MCTSVFAKNGLRIIYFTTFMMHMYDQTIHLTLVGSIDGEVSALRVVIVRDFYNGQDKDY